MTRPLDIRVALNGRTRRLSHIRRYSSIPVLRGENVAEHSWQVAFYGYLMALDLGARGVELSLEGVLVRALAHDVSEAVSGDIIRSYKYGTPAIRAATKEADDLNMRSLSREFGDPGVYLYHDWREAKDDTPEGRIVAFADWLCVVAYCVEEHHLGNRHMDPILREAYENLLAPLHSDPLVGCYVDQLFPNRTHTDAYRKEDQ